MAAAHQRALPSVDVAIDAGESDFVDVSMLTRVRHAKSRRTAHSHYGPLWVDLDGDEFLDLIFMNHGKRPALLRGRAGEGFTDVFPTSGLRHGDPAYFNQWDRHGGSCADYDNDGDVDLFITHGGGRGRTLGVKYDELLRHVDGSLVFEDVTHEAGVLNTNGRGRLPTWIDYDRDGWVDLYVGNADTANALYHNNGDGSFSDVSAETGLDIVESRLHGWADFDADGDMDLVALPPLGLYRNEGAGGFIAVDAEESGLKGSGRTIAVGDLDGNEWPDLFVPAIWPSPNRLFRNDHGRFTDVEADLGPGQDGVCKGAVWGDIDNDGDQDIVVACTDGLYLVENLGCDGVSARELRVEPPLELDVDADVALGDWNNDGLLDLAVNAKDGNHLLHNVGEGGAWLRVVFRGTASNRMGFGAKLSLSLVDGRRIHREYVGDTGFFGSSGCGPLHVGLGASQVVDLQVDWPSGIRQNLEGVRANLEIEVLEPSGVQGLLSRRF